MKISFHLLTILGIVILSLNSCDPIYWYSYKIQNDTEQDIKLYFVLGNKQDSTHIIKANSVSEFYYLQYGIGHARDLNEQFLNEFFDSLTIYHSNFIIEDSFIHDRKNWKFNVDGKGGGTGNYILVIE